MVNTESGRARKRLAIAWAMGTLVSALGVYQSLQLDLPAGARDWVRIAGL